MFIEEYLFVGGNKSFYFFSCHMYNFLIDKIVVYSDFKKKKNE